VLSSKYPLCGNLSCLQSILFPPSIYILEEKRVGKSLDCIFK
jgi:hypothetical protein